ncbi:TldD/PmbA family protein [Thermosphaera aggregans]|jgi:TldD protein|uniref:TldD/PmbA family protein n=1 Tax=Thermosphaera aggregans TaxID=54254 RepID=UPI00069A0223|nr:TldD/PmbA family protein [Thermosphaera aggregans]
MELDFDSIVNYGIKLGAEFIDLRYQEHLYESIVLDNGVVRDAGVSFTRGLGVRVIIGDRVGYSFTNIMSDENLKLTVEKAVKIARYTGSYGSVVSMEARNMVKDRIVSHYGIDPFDIDYTEKIEILNLVHKKLREFKEISSITLPYAFEKDRRVYVSSNGDFVDFTRRMIGFGLRLVAHSNNTYESLSVSESTVGGWEFFKAFDLEEYAASNARLLIESLTAPHVHPGRYDIVLDNEMVGLMLHEAFGHATEGDIVEAGGSVLAGRIGEQVASELVTIVDDGRVPGGVYVPYDDEGTPKLKVFSVENGVLKSFLHSRSTAKSLGGTPTGNARVMSYNHSILVRQTNTYMLPRDWGVEEMIRDMRRGIYVKGKGALGGEVNPLTGSFTFTSGPSYIIEKGEPVKLVKGVMLSGIILDTLKRVDAVGKDLVVKTSVFGGCGKSGQMVRVGDGGPHVRVRGFVLGG